MSWCVRLPRHKWPKSQTNIEDPERNVVIHHPDCRVKNSSVKFYCDLDWKKVPIWEYRQGWLLSEPVDDIRMTGRTGRIRLPWMMKKVDLDESISFLDQLECNSTEIIVKGQQTFFQGGETSLKNCRVTLRYWRDMRKSALRGNVS